jgi:cytochrome-b5 reductase
MSRFITHDVKQYILELPDGLDYVPGQGVELSIQEQGWEEEGRPFTPTCLLREGVLEFTIKSYPEHDGMTRHLTDLEPGTRLKISEPFGTISYKGPGVFIAGGAGITPFLAILRDLADKGSLDGHGLIFSNKAPADVICERELRHHLGDRCILTCTRDSDPGYDNRYVDRAYLREKISDFDQQFYVCGPPKMVEDVGEALRQEGADADALVFER